ncbi:MAG: hypothetical protein J6Y67_04130 [Lachnospiraceae bacterium]|nr:hypothetical protein [Lachnospiraceae bacterium]
MDEWNQDEPIVITEEQAQAQAQETQTQAPQEEKKKSSIVGTILGILLLGGALIAVGVIGIHTLMLRKDMKTQDAEREIVLEKGTWTKFQAYYATPEAVEYKHSVNFIPTAKEHFFLVFSKDLSEMALVRADKDWFDDNFTEDYWEAKDPGGVTVEGYVRSTDYDVKTEANKAVKSIVSNVGKSFKIDYELFIDLIARKLSIYQILLMMIPIVAGGIIFVVRRVLSESRLDSSTGKVLLGVMIAGFFAYGIFAIHVIEFF